MIPLQLSWGVRWPSVSLQPLSEEIVGSRLCSVFGGIAIHCDLSTYCGIFEAI